MNPRQHIWCLYVRLLVVDCYLYTHKITLPVNVFLNLSSHFRGSCRDTSSFHLSWTALRFWHLSRLDWWLLHSHFRGELHEGLGLLSWGEQDMNYVFSDCQWLALKSRIWVVKRRRNVRRQIKLEFNCIIPWLKPLFHVAYLTFHTHELIALVLHPVKLPRQHKFFSLFVLIFPCPVQECLKRCLLATLDAQIQDTSRNRLVQLETSRCLNSFSWIISPFFVLYLHHSMILLALDLITKEIIIKSLWTWEIQLI